MSSTLNPIARGRFYGSNYGAGLRTNCWSLGSKNHVDFCKDYDGVGGYRYWPYADAGGCTAEGNKNWCARLPGTDVCPSFSAGGPVDWRINYDKSTKLDPPVDGQIRGENGEGVNWDPIAIECQYSLSQIATEQDLIKWKEAFEDDTDMSDIIYRTVCSLPTKGGVASTTCQNWCADMDNRYGPGTCDQYMKNYCNTKDGQADPKCKCILSRTPVPSCFDVECTSQAYQTKEHLNTGKDCAGGCVQFINCVQEVKNCDPSVQNCNQNGGDCNINNNKFVATCPDYVNNQPPTGPSADGNFFADNKWYLLGAAGAVTFLAALFIVVRSGRKSS